MEYFLIIFGIGFIIVALASMFLNKRHSIAMQKEYEARQRAYKEYAAKSKVKASAVMHKAAEARKNTSVPSHSACRSRNHSKAHCTSSCRDYCNDEGPDVLTTMLVADAIFDSGPSHSFSGGGGYSGGGGASGGWDSSDCGSSSCDCGGGGD